MQYQLLGRFTNNEYLHKLTVGNRHVHFLESVTEVSDGHVHKFRVGTLIEDPIGE